MSLSDELAELRKPVPKCGVCRWRDELSEADRAEFDACLDDGVPAAAVHRVCKQNGLDRNESSFRKHIRECHKAKS